MTWCEWVVEDDGIVLAVVAGQSEQTAQELELVPASSSSSA